MEVELPHESICSLTLQRTMSAGQRPSKNYQEEREKSLNDKTREILNFVALYMSPKKLRRKENAFYLDEGLAPKRVFGFQDPRVVDYSSPLMDSSNKNLW